MRRSVANSVAGGLVGSAVVMGVDAAINQALAASITVNPVVSGDTLEGLSGDTINAVTVTGLEDGLTCCVLEGPNGNVTVTDFEFETFDSGLGDLRAATLGLTLNNLGVGDTINGMTCCPTLDDFLLDQSSLTAVFAGVTVTGLSGDTINGLPTDTIDAIFFDTINGLFPDLFDGDGIANLDVSNLVQNGDLKFSFGFSLPFVEENSVGPIDPNKPPTISLGLTYEYEEAVIPLPSAGLLGATSILAISAVGFARRRRRRG